MTPQPPRKTLLLLDDDPHVLKALRFSLEQFDCEIHSFNRPLDALQLLGERPVNVIIADLCMPQMDGREFMRRAAKLQPEAVRITLSGYMEEEQTQTAAPLESWRCLEKPWRAAELCQTVTEALARSASA